MFDESFIGLRDSYCSTASYAATPSAAVISDSGSCVRAEVVSSWRDLDENKMRNFVDSFELQGEYMIRTSIHSTEVLKPPISSISPSNLRKVTVKSVEKKQIIEISAFDVKKFCRIESSSIHGAPIGDSWFGGVSWSTDENYFTFIAKSKDPETVTAIGLDAIKNEKVSSSDSSASKLISSFEFVDDWGEKYESTSALSIVVVSVLDGKVKTVSGIDSKCFSVGQPVFLPSASESLKLAYTAWSIQYRKLGMIYCYHRPCSVFVVDVTDLFKSAESVNNNANSLASSSGSNSSDEKVLSPDICSHRCISDGLYLARSARCDPSGKAIVFVGRRSELRTHNGCMELFRYSLEDDSLKCIIESIECPTDAASFPGLFCDQLPRNCFLSDGRVVFNTAFGSKEAILSVNCNDSQIEVISRKIAAKVQALHGNKFDDINPTWNDNQMASYSIIEVKNNWILINHTSPSTPSTLFMYNVESDTLFSLPPSHARAYSPVASFPSSNNGFDASTLITEQSISGICWKTFRYDVDSIPIEFILMVPPLHSLSDSESRQPLPMVVVPHGGPHSSFSASFLSPYSFLCIQLNAAILLVNYRGSTGFGQSSIDKLVANIGSVDVSDCVFCINKCLELVYDDIYISLTTKTSSVSYSDDGTRASQRKLICSDRIAVCGGSHGGFLAAHLIGQFPGMFRAACMRNPVTNIPSMTTTSDIPDWCWIEATGVYNFKKFVVPNPEIMQKMFEVSPVRYVNEVKTPTLICLGAKDKRVPLSQGVEYFHLLQSLGVESKLLVFPEDCHAIDKPKTEAEHWIAIASWLKAKLA